MKEPQAVRVIEPGDQVAYGEKRFIVEEIRADGRVNGKNGMINFAGFDQDLLKITHRPTPSFATAAA